jgi:hypothetical protein
MCLRRKAFCVFAKHVFEPGLNRINFPLTSFSKSCTKSGQVQRQLKPELWLKPQVRNGGPWFEVHGSLSSRQTAEH